MQETAYRQQLNDAWMYVRFTTEGKTVIDFVVALSAIIRGRLVQIARYNSAHGMLHQDIEHPSGRLEKRWLTGLGLNAALTVAIKDLQTNWRHYIAEYEREARR